MATTGECLKARFMHNNMLDNISSTVTASSETVGFEVSNLLDTRRTKTWKPTGNFTIHNGNNKIYINDGSDKTGTLTNGNYTTTGIATQMQTVLNTVSSGWSVSYSSSTYKFTFSRTSGTMRVSVTTNAIWDDIGFTGSVDEAFVTSIVTDEIRIHNYEYIDMDLGTSSFNNKFLGFVGPIGEAIPISRNAVVKIQYDNIPLDLANTPALEVTLTRDDRGYFHFNETDTFYRYSRLLIDDRTNSNGPSSLAMGYLYHGDYLDFTTTNIARGFSEEIVDPSTVQETDSGRRFFNKRTPYNKLNNLQIQLPTLAEKKDFQQFVYEHGLTDPWFISLDPGLRISETLADLTYFVYFESLPNFNHRFVSYYDIQPFTVREVI